jgi:hypothetical protein
MECLYPFNLKADDHLWKLAEFGLFIFNVGTPATQKTQANDIDNEGECFNLKAV